MDHINLLVRCLQRSVARAAAITVDYVVRRVVHLKASRCNCCVGLHGKGAIDGINVAASAANEALHARIQPLYVCLARWHKREDHWRFWHVLNPDVHSYGLRSRTALVGGNDIHGKGARDHLERIQQIRLSRDGIKILVVKVL